MQDQALQSFITGVLVGFIAAIFPVRHYMRVYQDRTWKKYQEAYTQMEKNCHALMEETTNIYRGHLVSVIASQGQRVTWTLAEVPSTVNLGEGTKVFSDAALDLMNEQVR
jgi:hypothetical protein